jgi:HTH-type transcriptional regulator/antitoxin HipB
MHPITTAAQIGATLSGRRKALALSQTEVAGRLALSQNRLSELENHPGSLTVDQLLALLNALGLELAIGERKAGKTRVEW